MADEELIPRSGSSTTLWHTEAAQAVIDYLSAFLRLEFSPKDAGKLHISRNKIILELSPPGSAVLSEAGEQGDMLYHDGDDWVPLANPGDPVAIDWVLRHDGTAPYWDVPSTCS